MKAGINSILAPILLVHSFFVQLPVAISFYSNLYGFSWLHYTKESHCENLRLELRNSLFSPQKMGDC